MITMLAETKTAQEMAEKLVHREPNTLPSFDLEFLDQFEYWAKHVGEIGVPSQAEVIGGLQQLGMPAAITLCVVGATLLIFGWRWFKLLSVLTLAALGTLAGGFGAIQLGWSHWWLGMLIGGLALLALGLPLLKCYIIAAVALVGAATGGIAFYHVVHAMGQPDLAPNVWIGAIVGVACLLLPLFVIFRVAIMVVVSLQGGMLMVLGGLAIALKYEQAYKPVVRYLVQWPLSPLVAILALAGLGLMIQLAWWFREQSSGEDDEHDDAYPDPTKPQFHQSV
ncbi:MAG: hypothetical protein KGY81_01945 [Phycisphaerae bacterium]|nr:hypothetical protein [Phycisphaerae bacterium]